MEKVAWIRTLQSKISSKDAIYLFGNFFCSLTVDEHLWFYARLKGMPAPDVASEVDRYIARFNYVFWFYYFSSINICIK